VPGVTIVDVKKAVGVVRMISCLNRGQSNGAFGLPCKRLPQTGISVGQKRRRWRTFASSIGRATDVVLMLALISNFQSIAVTLGSRGGLLRKGLLTRVRRKSAATFFSIVARLVVLIQRIIHMRHITSPTPCPKKHTTRPRCHQSRQSPRLEVLSIHPPSRRLEFLWHR
jgi:hypothetical protein